MTKNDWADGTKAVNKFELNIAFFTIKEYYFGDDNNTKQLEERGKYSEPTYVPFLDKNLLITTKNIQSNLQELVKYYESILRLSRKYNKNPNHFYFGIRPFIKDLETDKTLVGFPWYDTLTEIKRLFSDLNQEKQGNIFFDADQSWQLIIDNFNGQIFIKEFDPDENEVFCQISIDRQIMIEQKEKLLFETEEIIDKLTKHFGKDYWTRRT